MSLWRVEVAGVSHRFVDAASAEDAVAAVTQSILEALDLTAAPASAILADVYEAAGPIKKRNLLAAMDGLTSPRSLDDSRRARRQLKRLITFEESSAAWIRNHPNPPLPPVDVLEIHRMVKMSEVQHIERAMLRLREGEKRSHLHD